MLNFLLSWYAATVIVNATIHIKNIVHIFQSGKNPFLDPQFAFFVLDTTFLPIYNFRWLWNFQRKLLAKEAV